MPPPTGSRRSAHQCCREPDGQTAENFLGDFYATRLTSSMRHGATQSGGSRTGPTQIGGHLPSSGQHNLKGTLTVPLALHSLQRRCQGHRR